MALNVYITFYNDIWGVLVPHVILHHNHKKPGRVQAGHNPRRLIDRSDQGLASSNEEYIALTLVSSTKRSRLAECDTSTVKGPMRRDNPKCSCHRDITNTHYSILSSLIWHTYKGGVPSDKRGTSGVIGSAVVLI